MIHFFKDYSLFRQLLIPILIVGIISACATIYSSYKLESSLAALEEA